MCNLHYEKFANGTIKCIEDEIPFELPEGWAWVRFGTFTINRDSERKPVSSSSRKNVEKKYDYYGASGKIDKIDNYLFDEKLLLIGEDGANLVTRNKPIAFFADGQYWVNNHAHCIDATDKRFLNYLCYFINAIDLEPYVTGSAQPKMNQENMNSILISLPPFDEQLRILNQVDSFYELISGLENDQQSLSDIIGLAKNRILDLAICGKLVPQNPDDEPASVMLERIRIEKEELIKAGKIKRDKKESVIFKGEDNSYYEKIGEKISCIDDEIQFEIPNSWEWCSITNISEIIMGSSPDGLSIQPIGKGVEFHQGKIYFTDKYIGLSDKSTNEPSKIAPANSVLLCVRAPVGEVNITQREICIGRGLSAIYPYGAISSNFLFYWLRTYKTYLNLQATGSTFVAITADTVKGIKIPLPPIEEQKRIVQTIESLYAQLNNIEKSLG